MAAPAAEHARFVRRVSASYPSDLAIARQQAETAAAAVRAAAGVSADLKVATQGHVLTVGDFMATLAVEATIHHLDLLADDDDLVGPGAEGLAAVCLTLDGLLGEPVPASWDDAAYALKGTGRAQLTSSDRDRLGPLATRFPLLG
jgi:hypothetical protein